MHDYWVSGNIYVLLRGNGPFRKSWIFLSSKTTQNKLQTDYAQSRSVWDSILTCYAIGCVIYQSTLLRHTRIIPVVHYCFGVLSFLPWYSLGRSGINRYSTGTNGHWLQLDRNGITLMWLCYFVPDHFRMLDLNGNPETLGRLASSKLTHYVFTARDCVDENSVIAVLDVNPVSALEPLFLGGCKRRIDESVTRETRACVNN